jgi:YidC/Oxa1 family membrane protein insertase
MNFLNKPIGWIINFCYDLIPNYAIALLIFTIVMKLILFPFGIKQQKNMIRQAKLRPKEMAIRNRYAGRTDKATQQKMQQEVMKLYQDENYNPASGCLPMILQLVIIFALYGVI